MDASTCSKEKIIEIWLLFFQKTFERMNDYEIKKNRDLPGK